MTVLVLPMQQRRGTAAAWTSADPVLFAGQIGVETDTNKMKVGDGETIWSELAYIASGGGGGGGSLIDDPNPTLSADLITGDFAVGPLTAAKLTNLADISIDAAVINSLPGDLAGKVDTGDPRLSDARVPLAHEHTVEDVTGLGTILDGLITLDFLASPDGAGAIGLLDTGDLITGVNVEEALAEAFSRLNSTVSLTGTVAVATSDGTTDGTYTIVVVDGPILDGAFLIFDALGRATSVPPEAAVDRLFPNGVNAKITTELGDAGVWKTGATGAVAPVAFSGADFDVTVPGISGQLNVTFNDPLPYDGGSPITALQYKVGAGGVGTSFAGTPTAPGTYPISGLTDDVAVDIYVRQINVIGDGAWSPAKTRTPTDAAYTSVIMDNQATASITIQAEAYVDSTFGTCAFHLQFNSGPTGTTEVYRTSTGRVFLAYNYTSGNCSIRFQNASAVTLFACAFSVPVDTMNTIVFNIDTGAGLSFNLRVNGVVKANTGDTSTGYQVTTAMAAGTIDWGRGSGSSDGWLGAGGSDILIGEAFVDTTQALDLSLFHDGSALQDWSGIAAASRSFYWGHGMDASQWNNAAANVNGTMAATMVNVGTFVAV